VRLLLLLLSLLLVAVVIVAVVMVLQRPTIRFYRNYGEGGYKQKAMLRFEWIEDAQVLEGRPIRPHKIF
jgi:hypothetical protein